MSIGGDDDDVIAALIGTDLPASWIGMMHVQEWGGRFGASFPSPSSLAWVPPGLEPGERFDFHVAVAWVDQQHNTPTNGVAPWYAVDTTPRELLAAAGTL